MIQSSEKTYKKATQVLNFLALKKDGKINKMKAIKLMYLADRLHLRKYGRPIVGDTYWAMKLGPVGSQAKDAAELSSRLPENVALYVKKYIKPTADKKFIISVHAANTDLFSKTDIECLETVYAAFSDKDQFELADVTHGYSEWLKHKKKLDIGKKRVPMDYNDFFAETGDGIFAQDKVTLSLSKGIFVEAQEVQEIFNR